MNYFAACHLKAINTATGEVIEQFASAPQLIINISAADAQSPQIFYLPSSGDPVASPSGYDPNTGTVSAGPPHSAVSTVAPGVIAFVTSIAIYLSGTFHKPQNLGRRSPKGAPARWRSPASSTWREKEISPFAKSGSAIALSGDRAGTS